MVQSPLIMTCSVVSWLPPAQQNSFHPCFQRNVVRHPLSLCEVLRLVLSDDVPRDAVVDAVLQQHCLVHRVGAAEVAVATVCLCRAPNLQDKHNFACSSEVQRLGGGLSYLTAIEVERVSVGIGCQLPTATSDGAALDCFPVGFGDSCRFKIIFNVTGKLVTEDRAVVTLEAFITDADGPCGAVTMSAAEPGTSLSDVHVVDGPALLLCFFSLLDPAELCGT